MTVTHLSAARASKRRKPNRCEWCGRSGKLEVWGTGADAMAVCVDLKSCEKHWPDVWPEGTRGVPKDRIAGAVVLDMPPTSCDDLELRRRAADGDEAAVAEMARRSRSRVAQFAAVPTGKRGGSHQGLPRRPASTGGKRLLGGGVLENRGERVA